jgi:outer membrane protein assembly factor BamB
MIALTLAATLAAASPFDDPSNWLTFAHDYARTGFQSASVGLSKATVGRLRLRWKVTVPGGEIFASPLVFGEKVIVVTMGGRRADATVYALRVADGSIAWSRRLGGNVRQTPSIDPAANMLFVGNRYRIDRLPAGTFFAIDLTDGRIVWKRRLGGSTHGSPVVAGGVVYAPVGGGDRCVNGGITAMDEKDGRVLWNWYVNPYVNPGGGGGVWDAVSFDGTHLTFGTGNTCRGHVPTENGAVQLTTGGSLVWSTSVAGNRNADDDTGGGVLLSGGRAIFMNKNGSLYALDDQTGRRIWATQLNPNDTMGGFATPSSDGSAIVVGAGTYPTQAVYEHRGCCARLLAQEVIYGAPSKLFALDENGKVLWSVSMRNRMVGDAPIVSGMAFAALDRSLDALDLHTGRVLWSYPTPAYLVASPAIVSSGVYAADGDGNVYAFSLPGRPSAE